MKGLQRPFFVVRVSSELCRPDTIVLSNDLIPFLFPLTIDKYYILW
jgi:hypothetical protein